MNESSGCLAMQSRETDAGCICSVALDVGQHVGHQHPWTNETSQFKLVATTDIVSEPAVALLLWAAEVTQSPEEGMVHLERGVLRSMRWVSRDITPKLSTGWTYIRQKRILVVCTQTIHRRLGSEHLEIERSNFMACLLKRGCQ